MLSQYSLDEAGFEDFTTEGSSRIESVQYTEKAFVMARGFVKHALKNSVPGFDDVLAFLYFPPPPITSSEASVSKPAEAPQQQRPDLLRKVIERAKGMMKHHESTTNGDLDMNGSEASAFLSRLSRGAIVMLRKHVRALEEILVEVEAVVQKVASEDEGLQ